MRLFYFRSATNFDSATSFRSVSIGRWPNTSIDLSSRCKAIRTLHSRPGTFPRVGSSSLLIRPAKRLLATLNISRSAGVLHLEFHNKDTRSNHQDQHKTRVKRRGIQSYQSCSLHTSESSAASVAADLARSQKQTNDLADIIQEDCCGCFDLQQCRYRSGQILLRPHATANLLHDVYVLVTMNRPRLSPAKAHQDLKMQARGRALRAGDHTPSMAPLPQRVIGNR